MSRILILTACLAAHLLPAAGASAQIARRARAEVNLAARDSRAVAVAPGSAGNLIAFPADPQGGGRDLFQVVTQEPGLVVTLVAPDGTEVGAANAAQKGFGYDVVDGGAGFGGGPAASVFSTPGTHTLFLLPPFSPRGTYQVKVDASRAVAESVVIASYFSSSTVRAGLATDAPSYRVGETVTLSGLLFDGAAPVSGASVSAAVGEQSALGNTPAQVSMRDAGPADLSAGDGIYTGTFTADRPGEFSVAMRATGTLASGATYSRLATTSFRVVPPLARFASFEGRGVDQDSDGRADGLAVSAGVDVHTAGRYQFGITLEAAGGRRVNARASAELTEGARQVSVAFSAEELGTLAADGPYAMRDALLIFQDAPESPLADFREAAGETSAYALPAASRPPIFFTGRNSAAGVDSDGDGKFDLLRIRAETSASADALYTWSGSLVDAAGREIDFDEGSAELAAGEGAVAFDFDGSRIGRHHVHGPYAVRFVLLSGAGRSLAVEKLFETPAFSVHEFEDSDLTPPSTAVSVSLAANEAGWHNAPVRLSLAASDNAGGSDVRSISYGASGAQPLAPTTVGGGAASLLITSEGVTTLNYSAVDNLGNVEASGTFTVKLDRTAPTVSVARATDANPNGWNNTDVTVSYTAADALSGLDASSPAAGSHTFAAEGAGQTHVFAVRDVAGNTASVPAGGVNIDKTPPDIFISSPAADAHYFINQPVAAGYSCADGGSGVGSCAGAVAAGGPLDTSAARAGELQVSAADRAGNTSSLSAGYVVTYRVRALYDEEKAHKSGSTIPFKLQLTDAAGVNLSSVGAPVTALGVVRVSDFAPGPEADAGEELPDADFSFDPSVGSSGAYKYNLKTTGMTTGSYVLVFKVGGDPVTHGARFQIR